MAERKGCQFIYNGHTGPRGKVCGRPESEHCPMSYNECSESPHPCTEGRRSPRTKVHHSFTRKRKCPTCGRGGNHALAEIARIIETVDNRCAAVDGPVTPTLQEMTQKEISRIYQLAKDGSRAE